MLFHQFNSPEERRESCFIEISYKGLCWRDDSLYIDDDEDWDVFFEQYSTIFCNGEYPNGEKGFVDEHGLAYYSPEETIRIIERLQTRGSDDDQILLKWLERVEPGDGFWILGI